MNYELSSDYLRVSANIIDTSVNINEVYAIATIPDLIDYGNVETFIRNKDNSNVVFPMFDPYTGSFDSPFIPGQINVMSAVGYITHTVNSVDRNDYSVLSYANVNNTYTYDVYIMAINQANFANVIQVT